MIVDHAIKDARGVSYLFRRRHPADELPRTPGIVALILYADYGLSIVHIEATDDLSSLDGQIADRISEFQHHHFSGKIGVATLLTPHKNRKDRNRLAAELSSFNVEEIKAAS